MATGFNTQIIDGRFHLQFETDKREYYEYVQAAARDCLDGKATDKCHRWISVEERQPEKGKTVLVAFADGYVTIGTLWGDCWSIPYSEFEEPVAKGTWWMPLPEAPEVTKP